MSPLAKLFLFSDLVIYQLNEKNGRINRLETYKGLPSGENELNEQLGETNKLLQNFRATR